MSFTLTNAFDFIERRIQQEVGTCSKSDQLSVMHEMLRRMRRKFDVPTSEIVSQFDVFTGVEQYPYPSGAKDILTIRDNYQIQDNSSFRRVTEEDFWRSFNNGNTISESRDGATRTLLINLQNPQTGYVVLNACDTYDGDGTWTADTTSSDAADVKTDTLRTCYNSGSVSFDIDVSQSANNYAEVYVTGRAKDISDDKFDDVGVMFVWVYFPSAPTYMTSIRGRWGNDSSNYFEVTATTPWNEGSFKAGWNLVGFDWQDATETGTVNTANVDYINLRFNYSASQTDMNSVLLSLVAMRERRLMNLHYATDYLIMDDDGVTLKEEFTNTSDTSSYFNFDKAFIDWILYATLEELFTTHISDPDNRAFFQNLRTEYEQDLSRRFPSPHQPMTGTYMEETDLQDLIN